MIDADVIFHFSKGEMLTMLPSIFPDYDFVVLEPVYNEIKGEHKSKLDNQILLLRNIIKLSFAPKGEEMKEYAKLLGMNLGRGESACMVYCRYNHNVVGSSNLADIVDYCGIHQITYLTTLDFLYYAIRKGLITIIQANSFIQDVISKGSKLPNIDMSTYICKTQM